MKSLIKLINVWKTYRIGEITVDALRGADLIINQGDLVAIMGPSGSGKSTLINMVGCLDIPTKGKVFLEGQDISKLSESRLAQIRGQKIGFIFQQFNLIPNLTAKENVMLPMLFQGESFDTRIARAEELLELIGLTDRADHKPTELSGGEQQRVAIARSLVNNPDVVLADEPTGNLDSKTGKHVMELLLKLHKHEKKTIIIVTHDKNLSKYAKRTVRILDGKVYK